VKLLVAISKKDEEAKIALFEWSILSDVPADALGEYVAASMRRVFDSNPCIDVEHIDIKINFQR